MLFSVICLDNERSLEKRLSNRQAHLEYVRDTGVVRYAGPFLSDEDETMMGSLIVIEAENKEEALNWSKNDPYNKAGLFQSVKIYKFKHLI